MRYKIDFLFGYDANWIYVTCLDSSVRLILLQSYN